MERETEGQRVGAELERGTETVGGRQRRRMDRERKRDRQRE